MTTKKKLLKEATGKGPGGPSGGGLPVLGSIGGGDGSYKIGRPRKPWMQTGGAPSMGADSGFASVDGMARVNRGYEDEDEVERFMFDDQAEEEDIENYLSTRKLPKYLGASNPPDPMKLMNIHEVSITRILGDTLASTLLSIPLADIGIGQIFLKNNSENADESLRGLSGVLGVSYEYLIDGLIGPDLNELNDIIEKIKAFDQDTKDQARENFEDYLYYLKNYIITIAQTYDSAIVLAAGQMGPQAAVPEEIVTEPAVNIATGVTGYFLRLIPFERLVFKGSAKLAEMIVGLNEIETKMRENPENNELLSKIQENSGQAIGIVFSDTMTSLPRLGAIYRELRADVPERPADESEVKEPIENIESDDEKPPDSLSDEEKTLAVAGAGIVSVEKDQEEDDEEIDTYSNIPEADPCPCPINEIDIRDGEIYTMSTQETLLRSAIREIISDTLSEKKKSKKKTSKSKSKKEEPVEIDGYIHAGYGAGYLPWQPDIAELTDEEQELYKGYAVNYKADLGHVVSQRLSESDEIALRNLIYEIANEKDEGIDEDVDEDDVQEDIEEASGAAAAGGGPNLPLGMSTPTFGRTRRSPADAAGSAFGGARPALTESRFTRLAGLDDEE